MKSITTAELLVNGDRLNQSILKLAEIGKLKNGGVKRIAYSQEDITARNLVQQWMRQLEMQVKIDAAGNIIGGEWDVSAQRNHPDLITYVATRDLVRSQFDKQIRGNSLTEVLQSLKPHFAKRASSRKRPLFKVVKALARMSQ